MTNNIGRDILFDIAGGHELHQCGNSDLNKEKIEEIITGMLKEKTFDVVLQEVKREVMEKLKKDLAEDVVTEMRVLFEKDMKKLVTDLADIKRDVDNFKTNIRISRGYVSFGNKRLVSVGDGKDAHDAVTMKQLK